MLSLSSALSLALLGLAARAQDNVITSDAYFYGQSEPVYPSPEISGTGTWAIAFAKAQQLVSKLTIEEKVNLTIGVTSNTSCSGFIPGIPRLGFPGLCLSDAGNGVKNTDYVSSWPSGIHVGASWNKDLAHQRAVGIGHEARMKGVNVILGPCIGPINRVVRGGRNWETFSVDPYLTGSLVYETVVGIQSMGVITSTKHFVAQEQETHRLPTVRGPYVDSVSSNMDDKTMHELYLWPFYDAVRAGTGNIMCSYNRLNNSYGCQNSKAQNGILKGELGFQGWVVSDWGAQRSGVASALGGLDMAMPNSTGKWEGGNLTLAVNNGSVPESRLNDMATRILASWYQMKQDDADFPAPGYGMPADLSVPHEVVDARDPAARPVLFDGAAEGHVLVKNINNALPLNSTKMKQISLFGYSAKSPNRNNYDHPQDGLNFAPWSLGAESANMTEVLAWSYNLNITYSAIAPNGTLVSGGGSGSTASNLISAPFDALVAQAYDDGTALYWDFESGNPAVNPTSDACIVIGNMWASEGYDRPALRDDFTDGLIQNVADQCANTIVVFHNAGIKLVDTFIDHPNVTAVIFAHLPGQESGKALISLLYGKTNPSGRLPYTVARNETDYGIVLNPDSPAAGDKFSIFPQSDFVEGVFIDYRHFEAKNITPRYEFGFGLSYTSFEYSDLQVVKQTDAAVQTYPTGDIVEGGRKDLWDIIVNVTATVANTGSRDGKDVAQLYLGVPGAGEDDNVPAKQLRGFDKPLIKAGESATVQFQLTRRDLSVWDIVAQEWMLQSGTYEVFVGRSSRDLPLTTTFEI